MRKIGRLVVMVCLLAKGLGGGDCRADIAWGTLENQLAPFLYEAGWVKDKLPSENYFKNSLVLIDIFDYAQPRSMYTLPYVKDWHKKYTDQGLRVVGIQAGQFSDTRTFENIKAGIQSLDLPWPVWTDIKEALPLAWTKADAPRQVLINIWGRVIYEHRGEGDYRDVEKQIFSELFKRKLDMKALPPTPYAHESDQPGLTLFPVSPEFFMGYERGQPGNFRGIIKDRTVKYAYAIEQAKENNYYR